MSKRIDITGQVFGRLTAVRPTRDANGYYAWYCDCDCGGNRITQVGYLRDGLVLSCGCLRSEYSRINGQMSSSVKTIHGHNTSVFGASPTYRSWGSMKSRCMNPRAHGYKYYGGRGIKVCERWLHSFKNFLADMGERPDGLTLDRYPDNDGNYEPGNCRWATWKQQAANRRNTLILGRSRSAGLHRISNEKLA